MQYYFLFKHGEMGCNVLAKVLGDSLVLGLESTIDLAFVNTAYIIALFHFHVEGLFEK